MRGRLSIEANSEGIPRTGFIRKAQVLRMFGISSSTLRRAMEAGDIPRPAKDKIFGSQILFWAAEPLWEIYDRIHKKCEDVA